MANNEVNKQDKEYKKYIDQKIEEFNSNGKKTIVYFCDTYYPIIDGVIKVLENYAINLSKYYNVVLVVPKHKNKTITDKKDYLVIGVASMYFKFVNYDLAFPQVDSYLKTTLKKLKIDIIHSHTPFNMGAYASKLAEKRKVPFIVTMHSQYKQDFLRHTNSEAISNMLLSSLIKVFNSSTEVWTMHKRASDTLTSYGYNKNKFFYIQNATEYLPLENPAEAIEYVNNKYNIEKDQTVFLFIGRLVVVKNIMFIADSLKVLKDKGLKFKMIYIGNGPDEDELKEHIKELGLESDVILTGRIDDRQEIAKIIQRSNLFLFPSIYDTSSIVQIEAAAFDTPGVFIDGSVTANGIVHNHNGFLCKDSVEDFAQTVYDAVTNKELLEEVTKNAHKELYLTWEDVGKKAFERYEYLIEENKKNLLDTNE